MSHLTCFSRIILSELSRIGISQYRLARELNIAKSSVRRWVDSSGLPSIENLLLLISFLEANNCDHINRIYFEYNKEAGLSLYFSNLFKIITNHPIFTGEGVIEWSQYEQQK